MPVITGKHHVRSWANHTKVSLLSNAPTSELRLENLRDSHPNHTRLKKILDKIKPKIKFGGKIILGKLEKYWYCASEKPTPSLRLQGQKQAQWQMQVVRATLSELAPPPRAGHSPMLIPTVLIWHPWPELSGVSIRNKSSIVRRG